MTTVLIVEDALVIQEIYRLCLRETDFKIVAIASDGKQALELLSQHQPEIVLLDLVLPQISGVDVLKQMSELSAKSKVIVVTSVEDDTTLQLVKSLGAVFVLSKPFKKQQLLKCLEQLANTNIEVKYG